MKAFMDIETGGFSITKNAVVEIGLTITDEELNIVEEVGWIIKPYLREEGGTELCSYKEDAMAIHGITMNEIENGIDFIDAIGGFYSLMLKYDIDIAYGHNIKIFDIPRLNYLSRRMSGMDLFIISESIDTLEIARDKGFTECSLPALAEHFGIDTNNAHRALGDNRITIEVYKKLMELC